MARRLVTYRGESMTADWPKKITQAQLRTTYVMGGKEVVRVRYGDEDGYYGADQQACHDCKVVKGEFHVPGCDVERCPKCGRQVIGCGCIDLNKGRT